ncbi:MAG: glycosyltransferase family 39 protein [Halobacteriales archaeon]|nr:glycosyltransferase family 39 protein [Halobacteriales archaeon]
MRDPRVLIRERPTFAATVAVVVLGALGIWVVASTIFPYHSLNHDEGVYLQQAAMLLEGKLWLHPPIDGLFRPWFFIESPDGLYSKYAPVPAAMFAVGELLGGYRVALVGIAGGILALTAATVREVFDARAGLLATVFVGLSPLFVIDASVFLPYAPTTLLNLGFAYGYLRADRTGSLRSAALAGAAIGLAFFARPFTAVLFATPFIAHALWTLYRDPRTALPRQAATAALGLAGVGLALTYNAVMTGSPFVFPYQAFAPLDGLGFGQRRLLDHELVYTPRLAVEVSRKVLATLYTSWVAGGFLGTALAAGGLVAVLRRRPSPRELTLAGLFVSVSVGNAYFWGSYNILGALDRPGDGFIATHGPYYHFDLLIPTAAFAAVGALYGGRWLRNRLAGRFSPERARVILLAALVVSGGLFAGVTAVSLNERLDRNADITDTYEDAYEPIQEPPTDAVVLLPDTYGGWLNHPFQPLRNDPGFDGKTVYALHNRPFAVADEYPDRDLYRYAFRGFWNPPAGSPQAARVQPVTVARGERLSLNTTMGTPPGATSVTVRLSGADGTSAYYGATPTDGSVAFTVNVTDETLTLVGESGRTDSIARPEDGPVVVTAFIDYPGGTGFTYRVEMPTDRIDGEMRALSPRLEWCRDARACDGAAAYIPGQGPDGIFIETTLEADPNT